MPWNIWFLKYFIIILYYFHRPSRSLVFMAIVWLRSLHPFANVTLVLFFLLFLQALEIRESCNCPTLPGQDPRLIFKQSMQHLLQTSQKGKASGSGQNQSKSPIQEKEQMPIGLVVDKGLSRWKRKYFFSSLYPTVYYTRLFFFKMSMDAETTEQADGNESWS